MKHKALFLDRDGVINLDHGYIHRKEDFHFVDGIFEVVQAARTAGYKVVVVTNQAGIGRGYYTEADFWTLMHWVSAEFQTRNAPLDAIYFCPYHAELGIGEYRRDSPCRKPKPGMLLQAAADHDIHLPASCLIGDRLTDMQAAAAAELSQYWLLGNREQANLPSLNYIEILSEVLPFFRSQGTQAIAQ